MNKKVVLIGIFTIILSIIISVSYFQLWETDINVPLTGYRSDSIGVLLEAANYCRGGNLFNNVIYNAPNINNNVFLGGISDSSVPMILIKPLFYLLGSVEAAVNIQAILNIVMLSVSVYTICIYWGIRPTVALGVSMVYANLPYYVFSSNTLLLIYGFAFYIPIIVSFLIKIYLGFNDDKMSSLTRKKQLMAIFILMFFAGINSAYYTFFIMILLAMALIYALLHNKDVWAVIQIVNSYIAIAFGVLCYTLPVILKENGIWDKSFNAVRYYAIYFILLTVCMVFIHHLMMRVYDKISIQIIYILIIGFVGVVLGGLLFIKKFTNYLGEYGGRTIYSVELGSMKIFHTIMPTINNFYDFLNQEVEVLIDLEGCDFFMMGIIVGIGFVYSIVSICPFIKVRSKTDKVVKACGYYNLLIVFLSVKGGGATIMATCLTTGIRNYNRICVFYGLFSLIAFAILFEKILSMVSENINSIKVKKMISVLLYCLWILGITITIPTSFIYKDTVGLVNYEQRRLEYQEWKDYITKIENCVPQGSMILELPLSIEGEYFAELMEKGRAYELSIPVIVSKTTAWSYGAQIDFENPIYNIDAFIAEVLEMGFSGIYIDTMLYNDVSYIELIRELQEYIGTPIVCNGNRRFFFCLSDYVQK